MSLTIGNSSNQTSIDDHVMGDQPSIGDQPSMDDLPVEILEQIINQLPLQKQLQLRQLNSYYREVVPGLISNVEYPLSKIVVKSKTTRKVSKKCADCNGYHESDEVADNVNISLSFPHIGFLTDYPSIKTLNTPVTIDFHELYDLKMDQIRVQNLSVALIFSTSFEVYQEQHVILRSWMDGHMEHLKKYDIQFVILFEKFVTNFLSPDGIMEVISMKGERKKNRNSDIYKIYADTPYAWQKISIDDWEFNATIFEACYYDL